MESLGRGIESEVVDAGVGRSKYGAKSSYSESAMTRLFPVACDQIYQVFMRLARVIALSLKTWGLVQCLLFDMDQYHGRS